MYQCLLNFAEQGLQCGLLTPIRFQGHEQPAGPQRFRVTMQNADFRALLEKKSSSAPDGSSAKKSDGTAGDAAAAAKKKKERVCVPSCCPGERLLAALHS